MNTDQLQELAWDASDSGRNVYVAKHETQTDVIVYVEVDGETFENEFLDVELEPNQYAEVAWRE